MQSTFSWDVAHEECLGWVSNLGPSVELANMDTKLNANYTNIHIIIQENTAISQMVQSKVICQLR